MGKRKPYRRANLAYELAKLKLDGAPGGASDSAFILFDTLDELRRQLGWPRRLWAYKDVSVNNMSDGQYANKCAVDPKGGKIDCVLVLAMADGKHIEVNTSVSIGQIPSSHERPAWLFGFGDESIWLDQASSDATKDFFHKAAKALQKRIILAGTSTA